MTEDVQVIMEELKQTLDRVLKLKPSLIKPWKILRNYNRLTLLRRTADPEYFPNTLRDRSIIWVIGHII
jgi:hypothetical protein